MSNRNFNSNDYESFMEGADSTSKCNFKEGS